MTAALLFVHVLVQGGTGTGVDDRSGHQACFVGCEECRELRGVGNTRWSFQKIKTANLRDSLLSRDIHLGGHKFHYSSNRSAIRIRRCPNANGSDA